MRYAKISPSPSMCVYLGVVEKVSIHLDGNPSGMRMKLTLLEDHVHYNSDRVNVVAMKLVATAASALSHCFSP